MAAMTPQHWTPAAIPDQTGRTALITGANSGIGLETARRLAARGARVILAGRSRASLDEAVRTLHRELPDATLDTLVVDLGSLASIAEAAETVARDETVDLLINNAGVMNVPQRRTTSDGFELTFGTNHLGHFALTAQLLPALRRAPTARIVTVSALAARWRMGALGDLMSEQRYRPMAAYAKSKRANVVFTEELARRLVGTGTGTGAVTGIEAVVVHPGSAVTNLQRHTQGALGRQLVRLGEKVLMGSPEGAAWPTLYAATSPQVGNGAFIGPDSRHQTSGTPKPVRLPQGADDPAEGSRLWEESERLTGVAFTV
jgi:NAD(P)-dependent dehydrogenase (short-subunit alcohol dehydrogenase family)